MFNSLRQNINSSTNRYTIVGMTSSLDHMSRQTKKLIGQMTTTMMVSVGGRSCVSINCLMFTFMCLFIFIVYFCLYLEADDADKKDTAKTNGRCGTCGNFMTLFG